MYLEDKYKYNCNGCTACKNICPQSAIVMKEDEEGFLYPYIDKERCINCGLCKKICKSIHSKKTEKYIKNVYGVKLKNEKERMKCRSGGAFRALAISIINSNGVVYGAKFDNNLKVIHDRIDNIKDIKKLSGSKYVQSDLGETFSQVARDLNQGLFVLYSGTACQIAGLNEFLQMKKILTNNLYTCDIVCHGVPSPRVYKDYLEFIKGNQGQEIVEFNFRDKNYGWAAHVETSILENKKRITQNYYTELFYGDKILRPSCYKCKYANLNRISDITIADFWGIDKINKSFNDNKGVSLVLINSEKGKKIFETVLKYIDYIECNVKDCIQPNLKRPTPMPKNRERFWKEYNSKKFKYVLKKYTNYSLRNKMKTIILRVIKKAKKSIYRIKN